MRQLRNCEYYVPLQSNPIPQLQTELTELLTHAKNEDWITQHEYDFLLCKQPRIPAFYLLPKVHKNPLNPPGRPIISGNESLTEPLSKFIDFHIKGFVSTLPSFIQDSTQVLNKIKEIKNIGSGYLVTMDFDSLYTNIAHEEGLTALKHYLERRPPELMPPAAFLVELTKWTLHNNVFLFLNQIYKQQKGTAMGACFAPNYANLFLGYWEEKYVYSNSNIFLDKIIWWGRYIDDVLLFWSGSKEELTEFHRYLNNTNINLKLSLEFSVSEITFLDLKIYKDHNKNLHTTIYRKPTDRNTILRADSHHAPWLLKNIPYGQFQRLRRICDDDTHFETHAEEMGQRFKNRGYKAQTVSNAYQRAKNLNRNDLLIPKQKEESTNQVYFVTEYSSEANQIKHIVKHNWSILTSDCLLREALPETPTITFRKAPTISNKLVKSYLPPLQQKTWLSKTTGNFKCGNCTHCDSIKTTSFFMDTTSDQKYNINSFINCNTSYVVYRLECPCGCFYIGRTKRKLKIRFAEHKQAIRTGNPLYPMALHFKHSNHSISTLKVYGIEHIPESRRGGDRLKRLLQRESYWIYTLRATEFPGLNGELDFIPFL